MAETPSLDREKIDRTLVLIGQFTELANAVHNLTRLSDATRKLVEFNLELQNMAARLKLTGSVEDESAERRDADRRGKGLYLAVDNGSRKNVAND